MSRRKLLLATLLFTLWSGGSLAGGNLHGTVTLPPPATATGPDTCFWRLGPVQPAPSTLELPSVVLEGPGAAEVKIDTAAEPAELRFEGYGIWPATLVVPKGSKILVRNLDDREYHCKATGGPEPLGLEKLGAGEAKPLSVDLPGIHEVRCETYPFMHARIVVAESPLLTRMGGDASFSFTNVPAGKYTAKVFVHGSWQLAREVEIMNLGTARVELGSGQPTALPNAGAGGDAAKPEPAEAEKPKPAEVEKPKPAEVEKPKPAEAEKPKPAEAEKPKPAEAEKPKPAEAEKPKPKPEKPKPKKPEPEPAIKDVEPEIEIETE